MLQGEGLRFHFYIAFLVACLFVSCDCVQQMRGVILDNSTGEPLSGVVVYNKNKEWNKIKTDSNGYFELSSISGGLFRCPPMEIVVEAKNYKLVEKQDEEYKE